MRDSFARFRIWQLMVAVALADLGAGAFVFFREDGGAHVHHSYYAQVEIGGHVFPHTSPVFWTALALTLALFIGLLAGLVAVVAWAAGKFLRHD